MNDLILVIRYSYLGLNTLFVPIYVVFVQFGHLFYWVFY